METKSLQPFLDSLVVKSRAARHPQSVTFELTYGCNLQCVHCLNPTHRALAGELRTEEIFRILEEMADFGILEICFTGGEPLTRPDLLSLLERAHDLGFLVTVMTNATRFTPEMISILERLKVQVFVSIYGTTQKVYESVTQIPGSYEKFSQGIKLLSASRIPVKMHSPVMTLNRLELEQARDLAGSLGFRFQYCLDIQPRQDGNLDPLAYRLLPEDKVGLMVAMDEERSAGCHAMDTKPARFIECECGQSRFAINPCGEMILCTAFPHPKYDLRRGSVKEGWEVLKRTADEARPTENYQCPDCEFKSYCRQGRSDAWLETGDMSVCLSHYRETAALEKSYHENRNLA